MKLKIYTYLLSVARKLTEELEWRVIYHTPVGPNPHAPDTIEYVLHEAGYKLRATHRITPVERECPWIGLIDKAHWPDQMGDSPQPISFERPLP